MVSLQSTIGLSHADIFEQKKPALSYKEEFMSRTWADDRMQRWCSHGGAFIGEKDARLKADLTRFFGRAILTTDLRNLPEKRTHASSLNHEWFKKSTLRT